MNNNVYEAPKAELIETSSNEGALASRWNRLWASMLDSLMIMAVTIPTMYFTGGFDGISEGLSPSISYSLAVSFLAISVFAIINGKLLMNNGQTIGKKLLGIKIVDLEGNLPTVKKQLLTRYATYMIPGQIPIVGQFFVLFNILFIFGKQKRCIHDYIAGTKVVVS